MLPLIQEDVLRHGWLTAEEIINFIAVSESTPGPFAINMATYVGMETAGVLGSALATLGVVLPSFIIILIVAKFYEGFKDNKIVNGCMSGLKPAVIGLIASAVVSVGKTVFFSEGISLEVFKSAQFYLSICLFGAMLFLTFKKVHPIFIILISAAVGILLGYML